MLAVGGILSKKKIANPKKNPYGYIVIGVPGLARLGRVVGQYPQTQALLTFGGGPAAGLHGSRLCW